MPSIVSDKPCTICLVQEPVMHSHHTVPQARGGKDSLQIILCSSCHNALHANAVYVVSKIRNPKRPNKVFWTPTEEVRARPWLEILVQALLSPVANPESVEHLVSTKLDRETFQLFKLLASELGSQDRALKYCIQYTLSKKGIKNEQTKPELWFLPSSQS